MPGVHRVAALVLALAMTGCLLPQDDHLLPEFPKKKNGPPRIIDVDPQRFYTVRLGAGCPTTATFKAQVDDPDISDPIRVRCFVDPGNNESAPFTEGNIVPAANATTRPDKATCSLPLSIGKDLGQLGQHFVEILVADGELEGRKTRPREEALPDGGSVPNPAYTDSFTWVVQATNESCQ